MAATRAYTALLRGVFAAIAVIAAGSLASCATDEPDTQPSISIPFDPYDFDADELLKRAETYCAAYGMKASYKDETIDPHSVRWRYRHYLCV